jgi:3-phosphoshikimate 1-carboxyvinyltransferase
VNTIRVRPGQAIGKVRAPSSKSYTHRGLIVGHLSRRKFRVIDPLDSDDTRATARGLGVLGTPVTSSGATWIVAPARAGQPPGKRRIECGESGTTLRFLSAAAGVSTGKVTLHGRGRLPERPMAGLLEALRTLGATCRIDRRRGSIEIQGPIRSGSVRLDASTTSQFASALLLVLPTLDGESGIRLVGPIVSAPYLSATLAVLAQHGVSVFREGRALRIPGNQSYRGSAFRPPGDASSAAYLWAAAALTGGEVDVRGVGERLPQADRAILPLLERAGATVVRRRDGAIVRGKCRRAFTIDLTDAPDLYPLAGVLAASIPGRSRIKGAAHVALKESDRRAETARLAQSFGARVRSTRAGLSIQGTGTMRPVRLLALSDHRLVMSAAVGALAAEAPSTIGDPRAVAKSFPTFWSVLAGLTGGSPP